jgi:GNAT superfamily N-acetyltransferase
MQWRFATVEDSRLLAELNHQLIADEGHRNPMDVDQLAQRMCGWLESEYRAVLFHRDADAVAYALFREDESGRIHLRQFFVVRHLRRQGVGREALQLLRAEVVPTNRRFVLEVLSANATARAFWTANGFREYAITLERDPVDGSLG